MKPSVGAGMACDTSQIHPMQDAILEDEERSCRRVDLLVIRGLSLAA